MRRPDNDCIKWRHLFTVSTCGMKYSASAWVLWMWAVNRDIAVGWLMSRAWMTAVARGAGMTRSLLLWVSYYHGNRVQFSNVDTAGDLRDWWSRTKSTGAASPVIQTFFAQRIIIQLIKISAEAAAKWWTFWRSCVQRDRTCSGEGRHEIHELRFVDDRALRFSAHVCII